MKRDKFKILWVDDEEHYLSSYVDAISESGVFELRFIRSSSEVMELFAERRFKPDLFIWDMIMPPKGMDLAETQRGLRTGVVLFLRFREEYPAVPAILFTNVTRPELRRYDEPESFSWMFLKRELDPYELIAKLECILKMDCKPGATQEHRGCVSDNDSD